MDDRAARTTRATGQVKWFDPDKGFGFIVADDGGPDILLHANVLRGFGQSSVADGAAIEVSVQETERGVQAVEIHAISVPEPSAEAPGFAEPEPEPLLDAGPFEPARVKWFDRGKGFGFANVFGDADDVFLHVNALRRSGLADLQPGEAISIRVADGRRGRLAVEIATWETGLP